MSDSKFIFNPDFIQKRLKTYDSPSRLCLDDDSFIKSAIVFLIISYKDKPYDLVLIRRTHRDRDKHAGEMSFPGGLFDSQLDKSYQDTALRETEEELGIAREKIKLIGCLDDHITPKKFIITPFVGYIDEHQEMIKKEDEVQEIIKIPINFFANKKNYRERTYKLKDDSVAVGKYNYRAPNDKKFVIFGATTHIIVTFIELVYNFKLMNPRARRLTCDDFKA
ncbi:MAG: NUDIX hydrolase [Candidatus Thorarchaeota archaeon]